MPISTVPVRFSGQQIVVVPVKKTTALDKLFKTEAGKQRVECEIYHLPLLVPNPRIQDLFIQSLDKPDPEEQGSGKFGKRLFQEARHNIPLRNALWDTVSSFFGEGINVRHILNGKQRVGLYFTGDDAKEFKTVQPFMDQAVTLITKTLIPLVQEHIEAAHNADGNEDELTRLKAEFHAKVLDAIPPNQANWQTVKLLSDLSETNEKLKGPLDSMKEDVDAYLHGQFTSWAAYQADQSRHVATLINNALELSEASPELARAVRFFVKPWVPFIVDSVTVKADPTLVGQTLRDLPNPVSAKRFSSTLRNLPLVTESGRPLVEKRPLRLDLHSLGTLMGYIKSFKIGKGDADDEVHPSPEN